MRSVVVVLCAVLLFVQAHGEFAAASSFEDEFGNFEDELVQQVNEQLHQAVNEPEVLLDVTPDFADASELASDAFSQAFGESGAAAEEEEKPAPAESQEEEQKADSLAEAAFDSSFEAADVQADPSPAPPATSQPTPPGPPVVDSNPVVAPAPAPVQTTAPADPSPPQTAAPEATVAAAPAPAPPAPAPATPAPAPATSAPAPAPATPAPAPATPAPAPQPVADAPDCGKCAAFASSVKGGLNDNGYVYIPVYNVSTSTSIRSQLCGPKNTDFDLCLQEQLFGVWFTVKCSNSLLSSELLDYVSTSLNTDYRFEVSSFRGSGEFTLCFTPSSCGNVNQVSNATQGCSSDGSFKVPAADTVTAIGSGSTTFETAYERIMGPGARYVSFSSSSSSTTSTTTTTTTTRTESSGGSSSSSVTTTTTNSNAVN